MDEREHLARILAAPDDDGPRLAYAAWLERSGDPRGAFIRAQCVLAATDGGGPDERRTLLQIHTTYERAWTDEFCALVGAPAGTNYFPGRFSRGFIESLIVPADILAAAACASSTSARTGSVPGRSPPSSRRRSPPT